MREFAEVFLELNRAFKKLHNAKLKQDHTQTYLISCDVTDLAQELEDVLAKRCKHSIRLCVMPMRPILIMVRLKA